MARHPSEAAPSPEARVRPAPPMSLSMLLTGAGDASPFSALRTGTPALRKVVQKPLFENFDETVYLIRPPTQLMRLVDSLRYHKPTPEERAELNLCSSTERLSLHALSDLLLACGGRKGFRFTSCDINHLRQNCDDISKWYDALDYAFKTLPLEVTQYKFPAHVQRIEDEPALYHELSHALAGSQARSHEEAIRWRAFHFQKLARDYVNSYSRLRETVKGIRVRCKEYLKEHATNCQVEVLQEPVEAEFEAKTQRPFPVFIYHLIQMYHREQRKKTTEWTPASPEPPVESIGVFSVFLSYVLLNAVTLTQDEVLSFEVLLQVLKLAYTVDRKQLRIFDIHHARHATHAKRSPTHGDCARLVTNATLCHMIFEFLSTVRELRLVSKQKNLLPACRPRRMASTGRSSIPS